MDLKSLRLCRLCLKTSDDLVNIFDNFGSTIASILNQHFWFQVNKDDGFPECLCEICWTQTRTFHDFYKEVESVHRDNSFNFFGADLTKQERISSSGYETSELSPRESTSKPDLTVIKLERAESPAEMNDLIISKEEASDFKDDYDIGTFLQISYQEQSVSKNRKKKKIGDNEIAQNRVPSADIEYLSEKDGFDDNRQNSTIESTKAEEEDAQIREFFNMECEICCDPSLQLETFRKVREHYRKVHEIRGYVTCCGKRYHRRFEVLEHVKSHTDPDAYRCEPCGKRFFGKRLLKLHMNNIHAANRLTKSSEHKCKQCEKTFRTRVTLALHERSKHVPENEKKDLQCDKCNKKFSTDELLRIHIRGVHEATCSQICYICAQVFKSKSGLQNHLKSMHSATPQPKVQCNVCGAWLKHEIGLKWHLKRHVEDNAICPICKKVLKNKRSMSSHMEVVHCDGRPHQCTFCDKAFKCRKNLKEHIAIHTGEDLYSCEYCDKKFKSNANKYKHRKTSHFAEWSRDKIERIPLEKTSTKVSTDTE